MAACGDSEVNVILTASCICHASGTEPNCAVDSVCFKSAAATPEYVCASSSVTGPKETVLADKNKFCKNESNDDVSLITGAGFCDEDSTFYPDCTEFDKVLGPEVLCYCGGNEYCGHEDVCHKTKKTRECYEQATENAISGGGEYALVGENNVPTIINYGQFYDAANKRILETCVSQFTPTSTKCVCDVTAAEDAQKCGTGQFCHLDGKCLSIALMSTKLTEDAFCGGDVCQAGNYCYNPDPKKAALDPGSVCLMSVTIGSSVQDSTSGEFFGYCAVPGKEQICYGENTICDAANGCACADGPDEVSFGACYGDADNVCAIGQSWNGVTCVDPVAPDESQIINNLVAEEGAFKCGSKIMISDLAMQGCYNNNIYPMCLFGVKATSKCICIANYDDKGLPIAGILNEGSVCAGNRVLCPPDYEYTDSKRNNCKKAKGWMNLGVLICVILAVAVVIAAVITGIVCCVRKNKAQKVEKSVANGPSVISPAQ